LCSLFGHNPEKPGYQVAKGAKMRGLMYAAFRLLPFEVLSAGKATPSTHAKQETETSARRNADIQASTAIGALPEWHR
jgi:hypothetical protein